MDTRMGTPYTPKEHPRFGTIYTSCVRGDTLFNAHSVAGALGLDLYSVHRDVLRYFVRGDRLFATKQGEDSYMVHMIRYQEVLTQARAGLPALEDRREFLDWITEILKANDHWTHAKHNQAGRDSYSIAYDIAMNAWLTVVWIDGVGHCLGHFRTESNAKKAAKREIN